MIRRILIVDDAVFMRNMLKDILVSGGMEVAGEAADGGEAVDKFKALKPDLVIIDFVMPFKSGLETVREIIKLAPDARIIMCSALGQQALMAEAIAAGVRDYIVKPFRAEEVLEKVTKALKA